jgi:hypothetical protein
LSIYLFMGRRSQKMFGFELVFLDFWSMVNLLVGVQPSEGCIAR